MPIYEYQCSQCQRINSFLILKETSLVSLECKGCGSQDLSRVLSKFAYHKSEANRIDAFNPHRRRGSEFYKDTRNIGLSTQKRMRELGVDLGSQFDEVVDKARSGDLIDI
jgi:putative FmdB family regulatory protein